MRMFRIDKVYKPDYLDYIDEELAACYCTELAELCIEMNTASYKYLAYLVRSVYELLIIAAYEDMSLYFLLEKNYLDYVTSCGVFDHDWEAIA